MVNYMKCQMADILKDAKGDKEKVKFLKKLAATSDLKNKNGKDRNISYIEVKRQYYEEFYKELLPEKEDKKTFLDLIEEL